MNIIIRSVTTLLSFFTLVLLGLIHVAVEVINADLQHLTQVWILIIIGIVSVIVIIIVTWLGIYKKDTLFYSPSTHILETAARLYGASQKGSLKKESVDKKKGILPKQTIKIGKKP